MPHSRSLRAIPPAFFLQMGCPPDPGGYSADGSGGAYSGGADDPSTTCNEDNEGCSQSTCGGDGENMLPGSDCLTCHSPGAGGGRDEDDESDEGPDDDSWDPTPSVKDDDAPPFTAGGTVYRDRDGSGGVSGAIVRITGADGDVQEIDTASSGNFFTERSIAWPAFVEVEDNGQVVEMFTALTDGACNDYHRGDGEGGGKVFGP